MIDDNCDVKVGVHYGPYWISGTLIVCECHRKQYKERADEFGPFVWILHSNSIKEY